MLKSRLAAAACSPKAAGEKNDRSILGSAEARRLSLL
jgi:hypothetical protein